MWKTILLVPLTIYIIAKCIRFFLKLSWGKIDRNNEISVTGKIVLITGANSGIGLQTALEMVDRGATVIMGCRNLAYAQNAILDIRKITRNGELIPMELDLSSLESIREFSKEFRSKYDSLDLLINNAGILDHTRDRTKDGFEIHFGVNHLGHFLLTNLLLEPIKNAAPSRIVTLSSIIHSRGTIDFQDLMSETKTISGIFSDFLNPLYANSKLANAYFNKELAKRLEGTGVNSYALCPGIVATNISASLQSSYSVFFRTVLPFYWLIAKTPEQGAATTLYCALSKDVSNQSGEMYKNCGFWSPRDRVQLKQEVSEKLWNISEKLVGLS